MVAIGVRPSDAESLSQNIAYGLAPAPSHVTAAFDRETAAFLINLGHCACDRFTEPMSSEQIERERRKYKEKGWNDSRIERVLAERGQFGGLDRGLLGQIVEAARGIAILSLLVYWDDGAATPAGPVVRLRAEDVVAQPWLLKEGTRFEISTSPT